MHDRAAQHIVGDGNDPFSPVYITTQGRFRPSQVLYLPVKRKPEGP
jgi:hypothetical protein